MRHLVFQTTAVDRGDQIGSDVDVGAARWRARQEAALGGPNAERDSAETGCRSDKLGSSSETNSIGEALR
jgi:hypothetical protein